MKNTLTVRHATTDDIEALVQIARDSFYDTFVQFPQNSPDDLQRYLNKSYTVQALADEFADVHVSYFVAENEGQLVGYAKLKRNSREEGITADNPIELCRLYNLKEFIGKGIGKALMLKCLEFAEENDHDKIWLGVWENNGLAINFYRKFGFEKCGEHVFWFGEDPQTDWLMIRNVYASQES